MQVITRPRRQASRRAWPCSPISASGALEASAIHYLGLVQLLTGHYPAAATSLRLALQLNRELGCRFREAETLTFLGDLAAPAADTGQALRHYYAARDVARQAGHARSGSVRPGRHRPAPPPGRQSRPSSPLPAPGPHHLPARREPGRPAAPAHARRPRPAANWLAAFQRQSRPIHTEPDDHSEPAPAIKPLPIRAHGSPGCQSRGFLRAVLTGHQGRCRAASLTNTRTDDLRVIATTPAALSSRADSALCAL